MGHLPVGLRAYLAAVMALAAIMLAAAAATGPIAGPRLYIAPIIFAFAVVALRTPLRLDHKRKLTLEDSATLAAALLLVPPLAMALTGLATLTLRFSKTRWYERAFNAAKSAIAVGVASLLYRALTPEPSTSAIDPINGAIAALAKYLTSVTLVDLAIAFQAGRPPATTWWQRRRPGVVPAIGTHLFGLLGAVAGATQPWVIALLAVPSATMWLLMRENVRARERASALLYELADVAELHEPFSRGRSREASLLAERIAHRMGMTAERVGVVRDAARLQHVGVVDVPSGSSTTAVDQHAEMGARRLAQLPELSEHALIVRCHHEHLDGSGPRGMRGTEIPTEAFIVGIADEYVSLLRSSADGRSLSTDEIATRIEHGRGTRWPADVADALLAELRPAAADAGAAITVRSLA